jgi:hypothetical protein
MRQRIAQSVARDKQNRPEVFCAAKRCLWRTRHLDGRTTPCPRHPVPEPVSPSATIAERILRFQVERITDDKILRLQTASELWVCKEGGIDRHIVAVREEETRCLTHGECDAAAAVIARRLNDVLGEDASA